MANAIPAEKQTAIISALCEGSSIRSTERMTGCHRDTIMRLGIRVGEACKRYMDESMRGLGCTQIQIDEVWGFVGKKQRHTTPEDIARGWGDAWTYVAIDPETKAVPSFAVGPRDQPTTYRFISDLRSRLKNRIQLSSDGMLEYLPAIDDVFGANVDYGRVVKTYREDVYYVDGERRYSPSPQISISWKRVRGNPDRYKICTSHIERKNLTIRMHMRRLTRLTNAFSKKLENFRAAAALHFGYYNFVKVHSSIRMTPAMALGVSDKIWTVEDLIRIAI